MRSRSAAAFSSCWMEICVVSVLVITETISMTNAVAIFTGVSRSMA